MKKIVLFFLLIITNTSNADKLNDKKEFNDLAKCSGVMVYGWAMDKKHLDKMKYYENEAIIKAEMKFFLTVGEELEKEAKKLSLYNKEKFEELSNDSLLFTAEEYASEDASRIANREIEFIRCPLKVGYNYVEAIKIFNEKYK
jgi:hypothetical protein